MSKIDIGSQDWERRIQVAWMLLAAAYSFSLSKEQNWIDDTKSLISVYLILSAYVVSLLMLHLRESRSDDPWGLLLVGLGASLFCASTTVGHDVDTAEIGIIFSLAYAAFFVMALVARSATLNYVRTANWLFGSSLTTAIGATIGLALTGYFKRGGFLEEYVVFGPAGVVPLLCFAASSIGAQQRRYPRLIAVGVSAAMFVAVAWGPGASDVIEHLPVAGAKAKLLALSVALELLVTIAVPLALYIHHSQLKVRLLGLLASLGGALAVAFTTSWFREDTSSFTVGGDIAVSLLTLSAAVLAAEAGRRAFTGPGRRNHV